jgi:hypothetical protein
VPSRVLGPPADAGTARDVLSEHPIVTAAMGWRIMAFVVLIFLGVTVTFLLDGHPVYGALWAVATAGWTFFTYKLYRRHNAYAQSL